MTLIHPDTRVRIPGRLDALGVPTLEDDGSLKTKREYIDARLALTAPGQVPEIFDRLLAQDGDRLTQVERFELEEACWSAMRTVVVDKRARHQIVRALESVALYDEPTPFLTLIDRFWGGSDVARGGLGQRRTIVAEVRQHLVNFPDDWTTKTLFDIVDAFAVTDRRFTGFLEGLASPEVRPDEVSQRKFVALVNGGLAGTGVELREVDARDGFPLFRFVEIGLGVMGAKNLIFASSEKPDLRFRDAINNDIEIVKGADKVLIYDRPLSARGLRWCELQTWWAEREDLCPDDAKRSLYNRLLSCLPDSSPPQRLLFTSYFKHFAPRVQELPALLPEVWLHWDPKTARERGTEALARSRMDFLMLLPNQVRVVIEVDGKQHYADDKGMGDPTRYAGMASADRDLRLAGYEVYRFGGRELSADCGQTVVADFFDRLFRRWGVSAESGPGPIPLANSR